MADQVDSQAGGTIPRSVSDLVTQLRGVTDKLVGLTGITGLADSLPSKRAIPRPAALSAAQLQAVAGTVTAQRRSIEAMQAQLRAFDQQLAVVEEIIGPLAEWTTTLAHLEKTVMDLGSSPTE